MSNEAIERRRKQILDAARRRFALQGYHDTNISDIAEDLKIGHGTFYRYFKNKRDIFEHVIDQVVRQIEQMVIQEAQIRVETFEEYRAQLGRGWRSLYHIFVEDAAGARLLFYESMGADEVLTKKIEDSYDRCTEFTRLFLARGKHHGFLRDDLDVEVASRLVNAMFWEGLRRSSRAADHGRAVDLWMSQIGLVLFEGATSPGGACSSSLDEQVAASASAPRAGKKPA